MAERLSETARDGGGRRAIGSREVKRANLSVYNEKTLEGYEENRSIFNPRRQAAIREILRDLAERTGGRRILDLGCGTGNLLGTAGTLFEGSFGLDLAYKLLARARRAHPAFRLIAGDSERLPFAEGSFDVVALYAVLHHILDPSLTFREAFRCLKPGGFLYTDHDPNHFFHRFYHLFYRLRHLGRPGFGSETEEIAEYHNTQGSGLNPEALRRKLEAAGFKDIRVHYRNTDNEDLPLLARLAAIGMKGVASAIPLKSLHTHFWILARK